MTTNIFHAVGGLNNQATSSNNSLTLLDLKSSRLTLLEERKKWRLAQKELKRKRSFSEGEVTVKLTFRGCKVTISGEFSDRIAFEACFGRI